MNGSTYKEVMIKGGSHAENISACETQSHIGRLTGPFFGSSVRDYKSVRNVQAVYYIAVTVDYALYRFAKLRKKMLCPHSYS